ncbi:hypothetical protein [Streptomyces sp. WM6386]|uniref:hypothetical protein n=1 Tax=Streptomyces sp. WM6386 TaxID=1415558 RepID=UPI00131C2703|nr:hypothetical protein [Streptomyces sp. WM6386]
MRVQGATKTLAAAERLVCGIEQAGVVGLGEVLAPARALRDAELKAHVSRAQPTTSAPTGACLFAAAGRGCAEAGGQQLDSWGGARSTMSR